jgi:hypothetical protein
MPWVAIVKRQRINCGRDSNLTYENVIASVRQLKVDAATFVAQNPTHPWSDSEFKEFIVDIPTNEAEAIRSGSAELFHDGRGNLPLWQQATDGSASAYSRGSFADPTDDQSAFTADVPLPDDRWIIRLYDDDPGTVGVHVGSLDFDEGSGNQTIYMKLFDQDDVASTTNVQNAKTVIAGKLMIFDFTSGVTTFGVSTDKVGTVSFSDDSKYRAIHPAGEKSITYRIFGRVLTVR